MRSGELAGGGLCLACDKHITKRFFSFFFSWFSCATSSKVDRRTAGAFCCIVLDFYHHHTISSCVRKQDRLVQGPWWCIRATRSCSDLGLRRLSAAEMQRKTVLLFRVYSCLRPISLAPDTFKL